MGEYKRREIMIMIRLDGIDKDFRVEIEAEIVGSFGVHIEYQTYFPSRYVVTHLPSGYAIGHCHSRLSAIDAAIEFNRAYKGWQKIKGPEDMLNINEKTIAKLRAIRDQAAIV